MINNKKSLVILIMLLAFSIVIFVGCDKKDDFTNLSGNVSNVTYASENGESETLSTFSTEFNQYSIGRKNNITLAAKSINGIVVKPGEVFSFNDSVGPTTQNNGFSLAKIFVKGKEEEGYGGGVCQVSSTLYNAADEANMEIVERHPHTKRVYYVPENRDAATSYGKVDFKFKNTSANAVRISTLVEGGKLTTNIDSI